MKGRDDTVYAVLGALSILLLGILFVTAYDMACREDDVLQREYVR